jgi:hypothetical protein
MLYTFGAVTEERCITIMETQCLQSLIGEEVVALVPSIDSKALQKIRLLSVEVSGLWIECEALTQGLLRNMKLAASKTPVSFLPYSQINFILVGGEKIALSESAFGLKQEHSGR